MKFYFKNTAVDNPEKFLLKRADLLIEGEEDYDFV